MHIQAKERRGRGICQLGRTGTAGGGCLDILGRDFVSRDPAEVGPDVREPSSASRSASEACGKTFVHWKSGCKGGGTCLEYLVEI